MSPALYGYVLNCFKRLESMCASDDYDGPKIDLKVTLPIIPDFSVRVQIGPAFFMRIMHSEYKFGVWTFDTCSPRLLRFSSPGFPSYYSPNFFRVRPYFWRVVVVDLYSDGVVVDEDPECCSLTITLVNPDFVIRTLRNCLKAEVEFMTIQFCSVSDYSDVRKELLRKTTNFMDDIADLCESYLFRPPFCPGTFGDY